MTVLRTYCGNLATGHVVSGTTQHGESLTDVEGYALPMEQATLSTLLEAGVADGLQVSAVLGQPGPLEVETVKAGREAVAAG